MKALLLRRPFSCSHMPQRCKGIREMVVMGISNTDQTMSSLCPCVQLPGTAHQLKLAGLRDGVDGGPLRQASNGKGTQA